MAAQWDGAAIPDGWVKEQSVFSILFYKAVTDRNIPHTGTSALSKEIDDGLMRYDAALESIGALTKKAKTFKKAKLDIRKDSRFRTFRHLERHLYARTG